MTVLTLIGVIVLVIVAIFVGRRFEQYGWIIASAAVLVLLPAVGENPWLWIALVIVAIVAWPIPSPTDITLARAFFVLVLLLGLIGLVLHLSGYNFPLNVEWTGRMVHFHSPVKRFLLELQQPVTFDPPATPTPTAASQVPIKLMVTPQVTPEATSPPIVPAAIQTVTLMGHSLRATLVG